MYDGAGLAVLRCPACAVEYGLPQEEAYFLARHRRDIWCPFGHKHQMSAKVADEMDAAKLREESEKWHRMLIERNNEYDVVSLRLERRNAEVARLKKKLGVAP